MKIPRRFALVVALCVVWSLAAHSGEAPGPELKTAAVAAFKNGLAFVVKQGDVRLEAGVGDLEPVPNATLGSLWIAPNDAGASLDQVVARRNKLSVQQNLTVLADVLLANAGKVVTVVDNNQKEYHRRDCRVSAGRQKKRVMDLHRHPTQPGKVSTATVCHPHRRHTLRRNFCCSSPMASFWLFTSTILRE